MQKVTLDEAVSEAASRPSQLIALDDALRELEKLDPRKGQIIELRFFGGLSIEETAVAADISTSTVSREQRMAEGVAPAADVSPGRSSPEKIRYRQRRLELRGRSTLPGRGTG